MKKLNKKSYEGVCRKVASLCVISLLLNVSMVSVFFPAPEVKGAPIENEQMCEAAVDVVLIMDRSFSMSYDSPTRLSQAQNAANGLIDDLEIGDQSALVSYATNATLDKGLLNNHTVTKTAVNGLTALGSTNIGEAIELSNLELETNANPQAVKIAILLTDGKANQPNGLGYGENAQDVAYAKAKAVEAADAGIKIFTIGLGNNVNAGMLYSIAKTTGGKYYYAPSGDDLEGIYDSIRWRLCEYGSISGCKYEDTDNDGNIDDETATVSDWEIILSGHFNDTQTTDENGCYQFSGLLPGTYTIDEGGKIGVDDFEQTYPADGSYQDVILPEGQNLENYDFGNYLFNPYCGNGTVEGNEECDDGNEIDYDDCSNECENNIVEPICGNGIIETPEECDEGNNNSDEPGSICSTQCEERSLCEDANLVVEFDPALWVTGDGFLPERIQDSKVINNTFWTAQGEVYGLSSRGNVGQAQTNESFYLKINGVVNGLISEDDLDPDAITTRFESLGTFPFVAGLQTVYMNTNAQYPVPDEHANSVSLEMICVYLDPYQDPLCGNGVLEYPEECDDGNNISGDGCSAICEIDEIFECGNGIKEGDEECDGDDGVGNHQSCSDSCELMDLTYCGDGILQEPNDEETGGPQNDGYEECDGEDGINENQTCLRNCVILNSLCRVNLDVAVVMDVSGSMNYDSPTRLSQAKNAASGFVEKLGSDDKSALVSFSTDANLEKAFSNLHTATQAAINNLSALGSTNIGDGIGFANNEFSNNGALKIEILLTDGRANKPNGIGYGEDSQDVAYAKEKAVDAATKGIKIFTIGLGSNINGSMLYSIADTTGGEYYYAPSGDDLDEIFDDIAYDICRYGSISGCKYEDTDNDGEIDDEIVTIPNWEIVLSGNAEFVQLTDEDGCYHFMGLSSGDYVVSESVDQENTDFIQTYPNALSYDISLEEENVINKNFGNYFPTCGNGITDTDEDCDDNNDVDDDECSNMCLSNIICGDGIQEGDEGCDEGNNNGDECVPVYGSSCSYCSNTCQEIEILGPYCGDGITNGNEECDGGENCSENCTIEDGSGGCTSVCGDGVVECDEECDGDDPQECTTDNGYSGHKECTECQWGVCETDEYCGDGITNGNEECDDENDIDDDSCSNQCENVEGDESSGIVINEIMYDSSAVTDVNGEWFELYNATVSEIELEGCVISDNDGDSHTISAVGGSLIVPAGGYITLSRKSYADGNGGVNSDYVYAGFTLGNGDDEIILTCNEVEIDRVEYNEGSGWLEGVGISIILNNPTNDNNDFNNWCFSTTPYGDGDLGTPGSQNDSCGECESVCGDGVVECDEECDGDDPQECTTDNGYSGHKECTECQWGVCETDEYCGDGITNGNEDCDDENDVDDDECSNMCEDVENEEDNSTIIINEIMYNPNAVNDADGEWFEVYNTTDEEINLEGCTISDDGGSHTIGEPLVVPANGYAVLANNGDIDGNGGIIPDYVYTGFSLTNTADQIILICNEVEIDRVEYDNDNGWLGEVGVSIILNDPANDNNDSTNWCVSTTLYGDGDLGTPGSQNDSCGECESVCGDGVVECNEECDGDDPQECTTDDEYTGHKECVDCLWGVCETDEYCGDGIINGNEECDDGNAIDDDECSNQCENVEGDDSINIDDIVINEIMYNPGAVDDTVGEWFELFNITVTEIDLEGCTISDNGSNFHLIGESLIVPAGGYVVLGRDNDPFVNGDVIVNYVYSNFTLGNGDDEIVLTCGTTEVDRVDYGRDGWPTGTGASIILNDPANGNNDPANWGVSTSFYYLKESGDLGTPGNQNDSF